jgi:hypothetical protein
VGTLSRKSYQTINLNTANFLYNGLLGELNSIASGWRVPTARPDVRGINICSTGCTTLPTRTEPTVWSVRRQVRAAIALVQTAAMQMRNSNTFNTDLAER